VEVARGELVSLREAEDADAPFRAAMRASGVFADYGPTDPDLTPATMQVFFLVVVRSTDGTPVGRVEWHAERYGPNRGSRAWNIGISLLPEQRGRGYGSEAQRLLAAHLFETTDVMRVEAGTDVENIAEQRALEKAGFVREGVLRSAQFRSGTYHDMVIYSRVRTDTVID
jgi:RimJ/RimL family protein N-acetyltransferase